VLEDAVIILCDSCDRFVSHFHHWDHSLLFCHKSLKDKNHLKEFVSSIKAPFGGGALDCMFKFFSLNFLFNRFFNFTLFQALKTVTTPGHTKQCSHCQQFIIGTLWQCATNVQIQLCSNCYDNVHYLHPNEKWWIQIRSLFALVTQPPPANVRTVSQNSIGFCGTLNT